MKGNLQPPELVREMFDEAAGGGTVINAAGMARFLERFQGCDPSLSQSTASEIMSRLAPQGLDLTSFIHKFLLDPALNAAMLGTKKPSHDMTAPLSHYYIHTSHNSYLKGNQLTSKSCSSPIVLALQNGCRVIELDCWEHKGKVMVFHGGTLTRAVPFDVCVASIKEHAFVASEYPVIVTIENHLPPALQQEAAKILRELVGDALYIPASETPPTEFLSPWELRKKIIISDKPPKEHLAKQVARDPEGAVEAITPNHRHSGSESSFSSSSSDEEEDRKHRGKRNVTKAAEAMAAASLHEEHPEVPKIPELQHLLYIYCAKPSEMKEAPVNGELVSTSTAIMANMSEPQLKKSVLSNPFSLIQYTKNNLGRMYPFGLRFDSSNADPMLAWSHGFQLAALNLQGKDRPCWVARGFFLGNGGCGYIKKPDCFLSDVPHDSNVKSTLKVRVLTGTDWHKRFDLFSKPDFYVKVAVHGVAADKLKKRTKVAHKTHHPNWETEVFEFPLTVPEIAVLRFEVWEHDRMRRDDFVGQACIPVPELEQGIRVVPLHSKRGEPRSSKLLCHFHHQ
ncbi:phosphoinositide phospholipase C 6 [Selaginella moellendorffii]|uniref:phosphoinositide phospholipase C 6 n=1 Tax=Selaginella moellendorffii TaxID=88036 RepID=UPI000D1C8EDE|nr:phosphoinositide phospholipase C 6 [Selaginella moellendorffii]|eukprot:XP_024516194.1 phosphoinositide phospholipase C 6 [Selaginella moellendorffii]